MITGQERPIYLASRSPRRRELLTQIGMRFHLLLFRSDLRDGPDVSEDVQPGETAETYVLRVAQAKSQAGWERVVMRNIPRAPVLAADTTVSVDGRIIGKPANRKDVADILAQLSGRTHEVLTAVALSCDGRTDTALSRSEVQFRDITPDEARQYAATGEGDDKAGSYGIQGRAGQFVVSLRGSYSGVMGLPLYETVQLIERMGAIERGGIVMERAAALRDPAWKKS